MFSKIFFVQYLVRTIIATNLTASGLPYKTDKTSQWVSMDTYFQ